MKRHLNLISINLSPKITLSFLFQVRENTLISFKFIFLYSVFTDTGCYHSKNQLVSGRQNSTSHTKKPEVKGSALGLEASSLKPVELYRFTLTKEPFSLTAPAALGLASLNPDPNRRAGLILSSQVPSPIQRRAVREGILMQPFCYFCITFSALLSFAVGLRGSLASPQNHEAFRFFIALHNRLCCFSLSQ